MLIGWHAFIIDWVVASIRHTLDLLRLVCKICLESFANHNAQRWLAWGADAADATARAGDRGVEVQHAVAGVFQGREPHGWAAADGWIGVADILDVTPPIAVLGDVAR